MSRSPRSHTLGSEGLGSHHASKFSNAEEVPTEDSTARAFALAALSVEAQEVADDVAAKIRMAIHNINDEHQRLVAMNHALLEECRSLILPGEHPKRKSSRFSEVAADAKHETTPEDPARQLSSPSPSWAASGSKAELPSNASKPMEAHGSVCSNYSMQLAARADGLNGRRNAAELVREFALAQGWIRLPTKKNDSALVRFVSSSSFDGFCAAIIGLNSLLLALSTDYAARNRLPKSSQMPTFYVIADIVCNLWFLTELLLRISAEGLCVFFSCLSRTWGWNMFDTVVVVVSLIEVVLTVTSDEDGGGNLSALRIMRVLRVARAVRVVRLVRLFKDLRMMVLSVLNSFTTLMWALLLLLILIFIFSVFLAQSVTSYLYDDDDPSNPPRNFDILSRKFDSLTVTMYTLFISVTGGISWYEISDPLFEIGWTTGMLFCFYIFFTIFAMLNIITGIFLESALNACKNDQDECISEQLQAQDSALRSMQYIFKEADYDSSGEITGEEFHGHLQDPRMRAHLASIGIEIGEAEGLFKLLDLDSSGAITIDEFLFGCMRLKGTAKAVDVQTLLYENKKMFEAWNRTSAGMEKSFTALRGIEDKLGQLSALLDESRDRTVFADRHNHSPKSRKKDNGVFSLGSVNVSHSSKCNGEATEATSHSGRRLI